MHRESLRVLAKELVGSTDWYKSLWKQRQLIKDIPALLLWGQKDPIFRKPSLERWQSVFTNVETVPFPRAGHFVQEEGGERLLEAIQSFLSEKN